MLYKTIILDRDGVINQLKENYVKSVSDLEFIPGSIRAINRLKSIIKLLWHQISQELEGGYLVFEALKSVENAINKDIGSKLDFYYCLHTPSDNCLCRKPKPGLILKLKKYIITFCRR